MLPGNTSVMGCAASPTAENFKTAKNVKGINLHDALAEGNTEVSSTSFKKNVGNVYSKALKMTYFVYG